MQQSQCCRAADNSPWHIKENAIAKWAFTRDVESSLSWALRIFWLTGICGALTTFSALCADVIALGQAGQNVRGAGVLVANVVLGLSALSLGLAFAN